MKIKKILITGVAGMIASHLLDRLLEKNYRVLGIDNLKVGRIGNISHNLKNKNFQFFKADILDFEMVNKAARNVDVILHLAALKKIAEDGDAFNTLRINTEGTYNIFEAARKKKTKVIFASTSDVYGDSTDLPFKETGNLLVGAPTAKRWSYAVSKIYGEQLALAYYKEFKVPIVIIRYFGGFSPRSSFTWSSGHIPLFIDAILNDREMLIHGDGTQTRSMAYVEDLVNGTILAMNKKIAVGQIFNIGNDEEISVLESAYLIHRIANTGKKLKLRFIPYKRIFGDYIEIKRRVPNLTKAKKFLRYVPKVSLEEGIRKTIKMRKGQS